MAGKQAKILFVGDVNDLLVFASCTRHPFRNRLMVLLAAKAGPQLKNIGLPGLFARSWQVGAGEARDSDRVGDTEKSFSLRCLLRGAGCVAHPYRRGRLVFLGGNRAAPAAHLSIIVLPFANLSGDPSQDYFADGITENLTTDLSRIRNSFVIARNTAFAFKGKNIDAKEISKELGVRYVLEGSVQRDQNRVRVNAQLINGETGAHLWADRFEEDVADLFKLQDQAVARLANSLGYELVEAKHKEAPTPETPMPLTSPCAAGPWCGKANSSR